MSELRIPAGYQPKLDAYQTQTAIGQIKRQFEDRLAATLNLKRVSAPLFVDPATGLNDDLNGVERAVAFDIQKTGGTGAVVHSLAKWKRMALARYGFPVGEGLYTDMNAIRRDDEMDNLHSIYVDQWDWERMITAEQRTMEYLLSTVEAIVQALANTQEELCALYPVLNAAIERRVTHITAQELEDRYPALSPVEREQCITREARTVFVSQIGGALRSGIPHGGRAPDYDDWTLNGDILIWSDVLECAVEISSMGIRVDSAALDRQLRLSGKEERRELPYHKALLSGALPLTIGGGIGQSRVCMLLMEKAHVGEVQVSIWDDETVRVCAASGVPLL